MPNWCSNYVSFQGERAGEVIEYLNKLSNDQDGRPFLIYESAEKAIFDFYDNEDGENVQFCTRWAPEFDSFSKLSEEYGVIVTIEYFEPGCLIFGKATLNPNGGNTDVFLEDSDWPEYNEDGDAYILNESGEIEMIESEIGYLEEQLEKKINGTKN